MGTTYQYQDPVSGSTFTTDGTKTTQTTIEVPNVSGSTTNNATLALSNTAWVAFKFGSGLAATSEVWATATAWLTASGNSTDTGQLGIDIYHDSAGLPSTFICNAGTMPGNGIATSGTANPIELASLNGSFSPANSTNYWLVLHFTSAITGTYGVAYDNSTGTGIVATSSNSGSTWTTIAGTGYFQLGQGTSHSYIASSPTGHGLDATTITGAAVYGTATGAKGSGGYFVGGPLGYGVYIDATNPAITYGLAVGGVGAQTTVDGKGQLSTPGLTTTTRVITANRTLDTTDGTVACNANNLTVTLPSASLNAGRIYKILNLSGITGTTVAVVGGGGNVQGGATDTTTLAAAFARATYQAISGNWYLV